MKGSDFMSDKYVNLFSPIQIGQLELKNRIVSIPHGTAKVNDGVPTDEDVLYWEKLAKGGVGLIITGGTVVHPTSTLRRRMLMEAFNEEVIPALKKRVNAVHKYGTKIIGQILHLGREMIGGESENPLVAVSSIQSPRALYKPYELTKEDIKEIIDYFALSAKNLQRAGYDGIEIHGAHGYLVAQFLSPATNLRNDEYGGTFEKRMKFLEEVLIEVRNEIGKSMVLGLRLSADEEVPGGLTVDDTVKIVEYFDRLNLLDYVNITIGIRGAYVKDMTNPEGMNIDTAKRIKKVTDLPVLISQRIKDPNMAEEILATNTADLVGMARALIADSEWPIKVKHDRVSDIIPCIGCNQECRAFDPYLHCVVNPMTGREERWSELKKTENPKKIAVVGGGIAGLEAARIAASRGHEVVLFEQNKTLGGQINLAIKDPNRKELKKFVEFLEHQIEKLGVEVKLGTRATAENLEEFEEIIIATGAKPTPIREQLTASSHIEVKNIFEILEAEDLPNRGTAIVVDDGRGFWPAFSVAEILSDRGMDVIYVTPANSIGLSIPHESIQPLLQRLGQKGVQFEIMQQVVGVSGQQVMLKHHFNGKESFINAELLIMDEGREQENTLYEELKQKRNKKIHVIGDALSPRRMNNAVFEAHKISRVI